jgi:hypothetical protein
MVLDFPYGMPQQTGFFPGGSGCWTSRTECHHKPDFSPVDQGAGLHVRNASRNRIFHRWIRVLDYPYGMPPQTGFFPARKRQHLPRKRSSTRSVYTAARPSDWRKRRLLAVAVFISRLSPCGRVCVRSQPATVERWTRRPRVDGNCAERVEQRVCG